MDRKITRLRRMFLVVCFEFQGDVKFFQTLGKQIRVIIKNNAFSVNSINGRLTIAYVIEKRHIG